MVNKEGAAAASPSFSPSTPHHHQLHANQPYTCFVPGEGTTCACGLGKGRRVWRRRVSCPIYMKQHVSANAYRAPHNFYPKIGLFLFLFRSKIQSGRTTKHLEERWGVICGSRALYSRREGCYLLPLHYSFSPGDH